jgi:hypothetical protein
VRGGTRPIWVLSLRITGECNTVCSAPAPEAPQGATQAPRGGRHCPRQASQCMVRYIRIIVWSNELLGNGWNRATERSGESKLGLAYSVLTSYRKQFSKTRTSPRRRAPETGVGRGTTAGLLACATSPASRPRQLDASAHDSTV